MKEYKPSAVKSITEKVIVLPQNLDQVQLKTHQFSLIFFSSVSSIIVVQSIAYNLLIWNVKQIH